MFDFLKKKKVEPQYYPKKSIFIKGSSGIGKTTMAQLYKKKFRNVVIYDNGNIPTEAAMRTVEERDRNTVFIFITE